MMAWKHIGYLALTVVLLVGSTGNSMALDEVELLPPEGFEGEYDGDSHLVRLVWDEPSRPGEYEYNVYRDGWLLATVDETQFYDVLMPGPVAEEVFAFYQVSVVDTSTESESLPSWPIIIQDNIICEPVIVFVVPEDEPPVDARVQYACIERWERTINKLINSVIFMDPPGSPVTIPFDPLE